MILRIYIIWVESFISFKKKKKRIRKKSLSHKLYRLRYTVNNLWYSRKERKKIYIKKSFEFESE